MDRQRIFVCADHGLAIVYFLQSDVVPYLLDSGVEVVLLTDDSLQERIQARFGRPGLVIEGLRLAEARQSSRRWREIQWWLSFLRRVGGSRRINTEAMDSYIDQVAVEEPNRRRLLMPVGRLAIGLLRRSRRARQSLLGAQTVFSPSLYADLFDRYHPSLVVSSTPGWRLDRYLLREAHRRRLPTASVVIGWDNPSSYSLPGAKVDHITCWSDIQKEELVLGSDWPADRVHVGGIPIYDGYFRRSWQMPRAEYFALHKLDPARKLIAFASSFVSFSPNVQIVEALAREVAENRLGEPAQLLVRLHPNHFLDVHLFTQERQRIRDLAERTPHVHVVEPVPLGGELGYYSGEDMPEKASMLAHADVFATVYSTMVVEAAIHDRPIVSACLDAPGGWNWPRKYSLPLSEIGGWPTHDRFRRAGAGKVALTASDLEQAVRACLAAPHAEAAQRAAFVQREITYTDGSAGKNTAGYLLSLLGRGTS